MQMHVTYDKQHNITSDLYQICCCCHDLHRIVNHQIHQSNQNSTFHLELSCKCISTANANKKRNFCFVFENQNLYSSSMVSMNCPCLFFSLIFHSLSRSSISPPKITPASFTHYSLFCCHIVSSLQNCFPFLSHLFHLFIHLNSWACSSGTPFYQPPICSYIHPLICSWCSSLSLLPFNFHATYFLCFFLHSATVKNPFGLFPY